MRGRGRGKKGIGREGSTAELAKGAAAFAVGAAERKKAEEVRTKKGGKAAGATSPGKISAEHRRQYDESGAARWLGPLPDDIDDEALLDQLEGFDADDQADLELAERGRHTSPTRPAATTAAAATATAAPATTPNKKTAETARVEQAERLMKFISKRTTDIDNDFQSMQKYRTSDVNTPLGWAKQNAMRKLGNELIIIKNKPEFKSLVIDNRRNALSEDDVLSLLNEMKLDDVRRDINECFSTAENSIKKAVKDNSSSSVIHVLGNEGLCGDEFVRARQRITNALGDIEQVIEKAKMLLSGKTNAPKASDKKSSVSPKGAPASPSSVTTAVTSGGVGPTTAAAATLFAARVAPNSLDNQEGNYEAKVNWLIYMVTRMKSAYLDLEGMAGENYKRISACVDSIERTLDNKTLEPDADIRFHKAVAELVKAYEHHINKRAKKSLREDVIGSVEYNAYAKGLNNPLSVHHHYSRLLGLVLKKISETNPDLGALLEGRHLINKASVDLFPSLTLIDEVSRSGYAFIQPFKGDQPKLRRS